MNMHYCCSTSPKLTRIISTHLWSVKTNTFPALHHPGWDWCHVNHDSISLKIIQITKQQICGLWKNRHILKILLDGIWYFYKMSNNRILGGMQMSADEINWSSCQFLFHDRSALHPYQIYPGRFWALLYFEAVHN